MNADEAEPSESESVTGCDPQQRGQSWQARANECLVAVTVASRRAFQNAVGRTAGIIARAPELPNARGRQVAMGGASFQPVAFRIMGGLPGLSAFITVRK